jgi:hypothetical protein
MSPLNARKIEYLAQALRKNGIEGVPAVCVERLAREPKPLFASYIITDAGDTSDAAFVDLIREAANNPRIVYHWISVPQVVLFVFPGQRGVLAVPMLSIQTEAEFFADLQVWLDEPKREINRL